MSFAISVCGDISINVAALLFIVIASIWLASQLGSWKEQIAFLLTVFGARTIVSWLTKKISSE